MSAEINVLRRIVMKESKKCSCENTVNINDKYFKSNSIDSGKIAKKFFQDFCNAYIAQNQKFFEQIQKFENHLAMPCLCCEGKNLSSVICAIDKITNIHLTEYTFPIKDKPNRRIDIWCRQEGSQYPYDFFIEMKNHAYNTTKSIKFKDIAKNLKILENQVVSIKKDISPTWDGENIYIGLMIIRGYHQLNSKKEIQTTKKLEEQIFKELEHRHKHQILFASWQIPDEVKAYISKFKYPEYEGGYKNTYDWISITGIVLTKAK